MELMSMGQMRGKIASGKMVEGLETKVQGYASQRGTMPWMDLEPTSSQSILSLMVSVNLYPYSWYLG